MVEVAAVRTDYPPAVHRKGQRMVRDDNPAKAAIIQEWDVWSKTHADNTGGLLFFQHLQHRRPDLLLDFKTPGDKWQTVHAWLLGARRVKG
jgi:hypothetical protein